MLSLLAGALPVAAPTLAQPSTSARCGLLSPPRVTCQAGTALAVRTLRIRRGRGGAPMKRRMATQGCEMGQIADRAVVLGASMEGLLAARVLAGAYAQVTVISTRVVWPVALHVTCQPAGTIGRQISDGRTGL